MTGPVDIHALMAQFNAGRKAESAEAGHLRLGDLRAILDDSITPEENMLTIEFDVGGSPSSPDSYRGYYEDLAFEPGNQLVTVGNFRDMLADAEGTTYQGYKGGDYVMGPHTLVWCSDYGTASGRAIVGVDIEPERVVLRTRIIE